METGKIKAFSIHFSISVLIFIVLTAIIYFALFPGPLFLTDGGIQGVKLIAGVDLVLGPLLTLLVYKQGKKGNRQDLTIIALLQVTMLIVGCYLVYNSRPIAVIFSDSKFHTMSQSSFEMHGIDSSKIAQHPFRPKYFLIPEPKDSATASEVRIAQLSEGPLYLKYEQYQPYQEHWKSIGNHSLSGARLDQLNLDDKTLKEYWVVPFEARYLQDYTLVNKTTGEITRSISPPKKN